MVLALQRRVPAPVVHPDEFGYLATARFIAGHGSRSGTSYYPGYSFAVAVAGWGARTSGGLRHASLRANLVLVVLSALLGARLAARLCPQGGFAVSLGIGTAVGLLPSTLGYADLALSENLLIPVSLGLALLAFSAAARGHTRDWFAFGVAAGAATVVHPRMLAVLAVTVAVSIVWLRPWRRTGRLAFLGLVAGAAAALVAARLTVRWATAGVPAATNEYRLTRILDARSSAPTTGRFAVVLSAQLVAIVVASGGTFLLAVWAAAARRPRAGPPASAGRSFVSKWSVASLIALWVLGAFYFSTGNREDQLVATRYADAAIAPVVVTGLTIGLAKKLRGREALTLVALSASGIALCGLLAALGRPNGLAAPNHFNVFGFDAVVAIAHDHVRIAALVVAATMVTAVIALTSMVGVEAALVGVALVALPSVVSSQMWIAREATFRAGQRTVPDLANAITQRVGAPRCVGYDTSTAVAWSSFDNRLILPDLAGFDASRVEQPCSDVVISGRLNLADAYPGARPAMLEAGIPQALWILPGPLQDRLGSQGWLLNADPRAPLPPTATEAKFTTSDGNPIRVSDGTGSTPTRIRVSVTHLGAGAPWPSVSGLQGAEGAVNLSLTWRNVSSAIPSATEIAYIPRTLLPGQTANFAITLQPYDRAGAPLPPGAYTIAVRLGQTGNASLPANSATLANLAVVVR